MEKRYKPFPSEWLREPSKFGFYEMNIFYLDEDPVIAAMMHCDKHVIKMIIETAQILSTAWHAVTQENPEQPWSTAVTLDYGVAGADGGALGVEDERALQSRLLGARIYNPTHRNHPCVQWTLLYGGNYEWLYRLGMHLLDEYTYRYGKVHACTPVMRTLELVPPSLLPTLDTYCDPPACMPEKYVVTDVVESYKRYYLGEKKDFLYYTKRRPPDWCADVAKYKELTALELLEKESKK